MVGARDSAGNDLANGGDTLKQAKPHPEPPLRLVADEGLEAYATQLTGCILTSPNAERDIIAAKSANMISAAAMWGFIPSKQQALA